MSIEQGRFVRRPEIGYDTTPEDTDPGEPAAGQQWVHRRRVLAGLVGAAVVLGVAPTAVRLFQRIHAPVRGPEGTRLWSFHMPGTVATGLVAVGNVVYTADDNDNGGPSSHNVYALDAATGRAIWTTANYAEDYTGPTVANNLVYVGSDFHTVSALHARNGRQAWQYTTGDIVASPPTVYGDSLYVGSFDEHLYALSAVTGQLRWRYKFPGAVFSAPAATGRAVYAIIGGNMYALDAATGRELWVFGAFGPTVVANDVLFTGMGIDCSVRALAAETGLPRWTYATGGIIHGLTVSGGVVYAGSDDGYLYAINAATGAGIWSYPAGGAVRSGIAVANGAVYFGSDDHYMYAAYAATGKPKWSYRTRGPVQSGVAVAGRTVAAGSADGTVYGLLA
ncbi:MAG TPA: PQQ-binding-like beta-propeller repeat protein [Trebonia sp.]|nr:PQQ-binding-like beta-propeller repeat protein [Trebonia sp.]